MLDDDLQRVQRVGAYAKNKTLVASEQDRPDVAAKREQSRAEQQESPPEKVVFIDET